MVELYSHVLINGRWIKTLKSGKITQSAQHKSGCQIWLLILMEQSCRKKMVCARNSFSFYFNFFLKEREAGGKRERES